MSAIGKELGTSRYNDKVAVVKPTRRVWFSGCDKLSLRDG